MQNPCIICGGNGSRTYAGLRRCQNCQLVFADLNITEEQLQGIYQNKYFFGEAYVDYLQEKKAIQFNFQKRLKELLEVVEHPKGKLLFEIGSAYGFFLELARKEFKCVQGVDVSSAASQYAREKFQLDVVYGDFLKVTVENQKYDVFCMWDTIEHLQKPHLCVEKISRLIKPNGIVCLTTGDIGSFVAGFRKGGWRLIRPPFHLFYFSRQTISRLLENYGFEVISIKHVGNYRTIDTFFLHHKEGIVHRLVSCSFLSKIPVYLNLFDIMCVIGRKI